MYQLVNKDTGDGPYSAQLPVWKAGHWDGGVFIQEDIDGKQFIVRTPQEVAAAAAAAIVAAQVPPTVSPIEFEMLWTILELVAITQLRKDDPIVEHFMKRLENPKLTEVVLSLKSNQDGIQYVLNALGERGVLTAADIPLRFKAILSGVLQ